MNQTQLIRLAAVLGGAAVVLGAFGAHGLRQLVGTDQILVYETGVRYQFYHALAIGVAAALVHQPAINKPRLTLAVALWTGGLLLFSGSLYALSLREVHGWPVSFLGPVTPLGGLLLIGGWVALLLTPQKK